MERRERKRQETQGEVYRSEKCQGSRTIPNSKVKRQNSKFKLEKIRERANKML